MRECLNDWSKNSLEESFFISYYFASLDVIWSLNILFNLFGKLKDSLANIVSQRRNASAARDYPSFRTATLSEKGILPTPKLDETEGFQCLGHSNWTICSPLSPFCPKRFSTFSLSYWEANSYYPRGPIMGKGNSPNFKI